MRILRRDLSSDEPAVFQSTEGREGVPVDRLRRGRYHRDRNVYRAMKAKELTRGNLVLFKGEPCWITKLSPDNTVCLRYVDRLRAALSVPLEKLAPIPLSPEILEKNGWKRNEYYGLWYREEEEFFIEKGEDGNAFWWVCGAGLVCPLNFVHQLQNALTLCRIEKEITLDGIDVNVNAKNM